MRVFKELRRACGDLRRDERGAVFIWFTLMILTIVSLIGISLEGAAYMNLHSNLQEIADASALSGAKELDGAKGARTRAADKARNYLNTNVGWTNISLVGSEIASVKFYSSLANLAKGIESSTDADAAYITVTTASRGISTSFKQVSSGSDVYASARATAVSQFVTCGPVQSYFCNPYEDANTSSTGDGSSFLSGSGVKIGDMFKLVDGSGGAPGNWGLIQPPGTKGNPNKNQPPWWSKSGTDACTPAEAGEYTVETSPGNTGKFAVEGQNVRFDTPSDTSGVDPRSAPVVISGFGISGKKSDFTCSHTDISATKDGPKKLEFTQTNECEKIAECTAEQKSQYTDYIDYCTAGYGSCPLPRDRKFDRLGKSGAWGSVLKGGGVTREDLEAYWANHHDGKLPADITTRFQLYQEEVKALTDVTNPARFTTDSEAREPSTPQCDKSKPAAGVERRLINVAIVDCGYWDIKGRSQLPATTLTARFFMTEPAQDDGSMFAELVDVMQANVNGGPLHHMVRLVK